MTTKMYLSNYFLSFLYPFQRKRTQCNQRNERWGHGIQSPAARSVRATCLQILRIQIEAQSSPEQPEHDGGQGNNVSTTRSYLIKRWLKWLDGHSKT